MAKWANPTGLFAHGQLQKPLPNLLQLCQVRFRQQRHRLVGPVPVRRRQKQFRVIIKMLIGQVDSAGS